MYFLFQFLITTRKTGFSVKFLYEISLDILFLHATFRLFLLQNNRLEHVKYFSGISKKYSALHLGDYTDDELIKAASESDRIKGMIMMQDGGQWS